MTFVKISAMIFLRLRMKRHILSFFVIIQRSIFSTDINLAFNEFETRVREIFFETKYYDYTQYAC